MPADPRLTARDTCDGPSPEGGRTVDPNLTVWRPPQGEKDNRGTHMTLGVADEEQTPRSIGILPIHVLTNAPVISLPGNGLLTNAAAPLVTGTATPASEVHIYDGAAQAGIATADPSTGTWQSALSGVSAGFQQVTAMSSGPGEFSSLPSAAVNVFGLSAPVNGVSSVDVASVDIASVLGQGFGLQFVAGTEAVQLLDSTLSVGPDTDAAYVARLFQGLFGTVPDSSNLSVWTNYLAAGHSYTDVAAGFLQAPVAAAITALPDAGYVQQLFTGLLGRAPSASESGAYTAVLAAGASRASVLAGIADAPEAKVALASQTARLFVTDSAKQVVNNMFEAGLGHEATQPVVQGLAANIDAGLMAPQLAQEVASTPEFLGLHAGETNAAYVADIYTAGLGRAPTSAEVTFDVGNLESGVFSRSTILAAIANSPEAMAHLTHPL